MYLESSTLGHRIQCISNQVYQRLADLACGAVCDYFWGFHNQFNVPIAKFALKESQCRVCNFAHVNQCRRSGRSMITKSLADDIADPNQLLRGEF